MRTLLRTLTFLCLALAGTGAMAQFPYTLIVQGTVAGCTPFQQVTVATMGNTVPLVTYTLEVFPASCTFDTIIQLNSPLASVVVGTQCGGQLLSASDSVVFNLPGDTAVVTLALNCGGGGTPDCLGIINGPNVPGSPCFDGDPMTTNDTWNANCICVGTLPQNCQAAFTISNSSPWVMGLTNTSTGMGPMLYDWYLPDGSSTGQNSPFFLFTAPGTYGVCLTIVAANMCTSTLCDTVYVDSVGNVTTQPTYYDCLGNLNGPNVPGSACNDNDPQTINDTWNANCNCVGTAPQNCQATFTVIQNAQWTASFNNTSTGVAPIAYQWWLPDGSTSTAANPGFTFNAPGAYGVCLTITASNACTSTMCDTVFVDSIGDITSFPTFYDCYGYPNGPNLPGTPCQVPGTILFGTWDANCLCDTTTLNVYDCTGILNGPNMPGTACVDTVGGVLVPGTWQANCMCVTNTLNDCLGIFNGPNQPGTACNDGNPNTINDLWSPNCVCIGVTLPPSSVHVTGTVSPCNGVPYPVHIFTDPGTNPYIDTLITTDTNCVYAFLFNPINTSGWVNVEVSCDGGLTWMWDSLGFTSTPGDTLVIDFTCGGLITDCTGQLGGPNMPGTPCNDGDTLTVQDTWTPTCQCVGVPVNYYDCLQVVNGPNLPGTPCDDNNPATIGDTWDATCTCAGSVPQPCNADFWVLQAYTLDSLTSQPVPTPNLLWVWNLSSGGSGAFTFLWNFGDGSSSTDPFPTHTYANGGPYVLCLTINDSLGCSDTYCDSVSIDANGLYTGMLAAGTDRAAGFTINVRDPLATGITEPLIVEDGLALWPNPVNDQLSIALTGTLSGTVEVQVIDLNGRLVRSERRSLMSGRNQLQLNTADLDAGLYLLRLGNGNTTISRRFVKAE